MKDNCISLYKSGKFFNVFGDDGIIIHYLLGYKFVAYKNCVGFPESALTKVKAKLDSEKLPYKIYEKDILIDSVKGVKNNYKKIIKISLKNMEMEERVNRLRSKLDKLTINDIEKVMEGLEDETL